MRDIDSMNKLSRELTSSFTLIELLIVVAIIGILVAIVVPNFLNAQIKATVARVMGDFHHIRDALELYRFDHNKLPPLPQQGGGYPASFAYKWLSTPVAYYTGLTKDPFQNKLEFESDFFDGSYLYLNRIVRTDFPGGIHYQVLDYLLLSFGPDRKITTYTFGVTPYHSSNGIISFGDIVYDGNQDGYNFR